MIFIYIFIARESDFIHDSYKKLKNDEIKNKKSESEVRHNINVMNEKKKLEQRANDYQEKLMKKYIIKMTRSNNNNLSNFNIFIFRR